MWRIRKNASHICKSNMHVWSISRFYRVRSFHKCDVNMCEKSICHRCGEYVHICHRCDDDFPILKFVCTDILMYMYISINLRMWFLPDLNWPIHTLSYPTCPALPCPVLPCPTIRINKCTAFTLMLSLKYHRMITVIAIPSNTCEVSYLKQATF